MIYCKDCGMNVVGVFPCPTCGGKEAVSYVRPDVDKDTSPQSPTDQDEAERLAEEWAMREFPYLKRSDQIGRESDYAEGYRAGQASPETMSRFLHETRMAEVQNSMRRHYEKMFQNHNDEHDKKLTALREENSRLNDRLSKIESSTRIYGTNTGWPYEKKLHEQLASEKLKSQKLAGLLLEASGSLDRKKNFSLLPDIEEALAEYNANNETREGE